MWLSTPNANRSNSVQTSRSTIAVILGGGSGTRLYPLTATRSKPAVPIAGKYRLVDIPISNCINSNINRMWILTQFNSASLNKHIKNTYQFSMFSSGFVDILAAEQTPDNPQWFQGTADAVRQSLRHFAQHESEYVLILSGDQLYQMDFQEMIDAHIAAEADISIACIPLGEREATESGIMKINEDGLIKSFIEKPKAELLPDWITDTGEQMKAEGNHWLGSMGIYIFSRKLLFHLLEEEAKSSMDFGKEILPMAIAKYRVAPFQYDGYWTDIGNIYSFFESNIELTSEVPKFNLFDKTQTIYTHARMLPPAKVSGTMLDKAVLADGSIINASRIESSVIGIRARIGKGTTLSCCYMMGSDYYETIPEMQEAISTGKPIVGIGENCYLKNCIIDKNVRIGNNVNINGGPHLEATDQPLYTIKDGIVVIKKNAVLHDGFSL